MTPQIGIPPLPSTTLSPVAASITAPLLTATEFFAKYENHRVELVKGIVQEVAMPSQKHGEICSNVHFILREFVGHHGLGRLTINDSFVRIPGNPESVRGADLCYFSYTAIPKEIELPDSFAEIAPELVVEVRSPSDSWTMIIAKVLDYLSAGVKVVVVLNPPTKSIAVYRPDTEGDIFRNEQVFVVPDIFPGLSVPVSRFFE